MIGWKNPYLIQRLQRPFLTENKFNQKLIESFSFGGGLVKGGFNEEGWNLLRSIFRFDYMGSAEFEWGEVPRAFASLFELRKENKLVAGELESKKHKKKIFYISPEDYEENVVKFINLIVKKGDYGKDIFLKESTCIEQSLNTKEDYDAHDRVGWIDIENYFMFFVDEDMFKKTLSLFGLEVKGVLATSSVRGKK